MEGQTFRSREAWELALEKTADVEYVPPPVVQEEGGTIWPVYGALTCPYSYRKYSTWPLVECQRPAGAGTPHEGIGFCATHNGHRGKGAREGAILMALLFADEMDVTPWEALLGQVRLLAGQVRWLRIRVENAEREFGVDAIKPGGSGWEWVCMLEARGDRLAKVSKMAIDAGVAEKLVRQMDLEAEHMVQAALETLELAGITGKARDSALEFMGRRLLELEAGN